MNAETSAIKVLHLLPWSNLGGTERHVWNLVRHMGEGFRFTVAMPEGPGRDVITAAGADVVGGFGVEYPMGFGAFIRSSRGISTLIGSGAIDLVHVHASREFVLAASFAKPRVPVVFTPHAYSSGADAWTAVHLGCRFAAKCVVLSKHEYDRVVRYGADRDKLVIIPNGVDIPDVSDIAPTTTAKGAITFGTIARLSPEKGVDLLIRAFSSTVGALSGMGAIPRLVLVGDGPEAGRLRSLARDLGVADLVEFAGSVTNPADYLRQFDVFVLSSRLDVFPLALCEAMAWGRAVIASDIGGIPSMVEDGVSGLLAPVGNVGRVGELMVGLALDPDLRHALGTAAREAAVGSLSAGLMAKRTAAVYHGLLGTPG